MSWMFSGFILCPIVQSMGTLGNESDVPVEAECIASRENSEESRQNLEVAPSTQDQKIFQDQDGLLLLLLFLKKVSSARLGENDIHPISPNTPAPKYQPIDRKKRKGKRVEDYSRDRAA